MISLVMLFGFFLPQSMALNDKGLELDLWAKTRLQSTLTDCAHRSPNEVFSKLRAMELEFSVKVDEVPLLLLKKMPHEGDFLQMGKVLFPAMLPRGFPAKLAYMACDEENQAFKSAKDLIESKERLNDLRDCFQNSYRIDTPRTVTLLLNCYQSLIRQPI